MKSPGKDAQTILGRIKAALVETAQEVRDISLRLRPSMLDDLGLLPTLLWHFQDYTDKTNIHIDFQHDGLDRDLPPDICTAAYRIIQESLTNIARHAEVNQAKSILRALEDTLFIEIEDLGKGFNQAALPISAAIGLSGMQERAYALGGTLEIESNPGAGTRVRAKLPLLKPSEAKPKKRRQR
jgi:signal transduction histidine kinase